MFVANGTQQNQLFFYRLPGVAQARRQEIPIGCQIKLSGQLSSHDIDAIIEQHSKYGLVRTDEVDRTKPFVGLVYSIDKPVPSPYITRVIEHNEKVLIERGRRIREENAVALNDALEQGVGPGYKGNLRIEVEEFGRSRDTMGPEFHEGVRVSRDAAPPKNTRRRRA
jgi:hypothetical protein